jgi:hypothetical protein
VTRENAIIIIIIIIIEAWAVGITTG